MGAGSGDMPAVALGQANLPLPSLLPFEELYREVDTEAAQNVGQLQLLNGSEVGKVERPNPQPLNPLLYWRCGHGSNPSCAG